MDHGNNITKINDLLAGIKCHIKYLSKLSFIENKENCINTNSKLIKEGINDLKRYFDNEIRSIFRK